MVEVTTSAISSSFPPQVAQPPSSEEESLDSYDTVSDPLGLGDLRNCGLWNSVRNYEVETNDEYFMEVD